MTTPLTATTVVRWVLGAALMGFGAVFVWRRAVWGQHDWAYVVFLGAGMFVAFGSAFSKFLAVVADLIRAWRGRDSTNG